MEIALRNGKLRPWQAHDASALARHADDIEVARSLRDAFPHPYTIDDAHAWIASASSVAGPARNVAIVIDDEHLRDEAVGGIGIVLGTDVSRTTAEIGYWLGRAAWGRGYATDAVRAMTDYAFATFGLHRIFALPFARNGASVRVLEKAGYDREGVMRASAIKDGELLDQVLFATIRR